MYYSLKALITASIQEMNSKADSAAPYEFEEVGRIMASEMFGVNAYRSSGISAGGDGGEDGYFIDKKGNRYKIACSICDAQNLDSKIAQEMKGNPNGYVFFCTNQVIGQIKRTRFRAKYPNIEFADLNNITSSTEKNFELKRIFTIPEYWCKFELEALRRSHQFLCREAEIAGYISRQVIPNNDNHQQDTSLPFIEWAKNTDNRFKLIEAPAGYGKTCLLQQLYMDLLKDEELLMLPVFCNLKNYKGIQEIVNLNIGNQSGYGKYNLYFILDGLDEMPVENAESLITEIDELMNSTNHKAMVILSARKNEYSADIFMGRIEPQIAQIKALNKDEVKDLIASHNISEPTASALLSSIESIGTFDNAFYVSSIIDFYLEKKELPSNKVALLEELLEKDKQMLSRKHTLSETEFNSAVVYETLTNKTIPAEIEIYKKLPYSCMEFSHRNIQEFAAAKALSLLDVNTIIPLISSQGLIVPSAKNTIGYLLSILANSNEEQDFATAMRLLSDFREEPLNLDVLFMIESDKLLSAQKADLIEYALRYYMDNIFYDIPNSLVNFIIADSVVGYSELISFIDKCDEIRLPKALRMAYQIILQNPEICPEEAVKYFFSFFLKEIANASYRLSIINELAFILRHLSTRLPVLPSDIIARILLLAEESHNSPEFCMSLFGVLSNSVNTLKEDDMQRIVDCFFLMLKENKFDVQYIPLQIKAGYKINSSCIFSTEPVYSLAKNYIHSKPRFFLYILQKYELFLKETKRLTDSFYNFLEFLADSAINLYSSGSLQENELCKIIDIICEEYNCQYDAEENLCTEFVKVDSGLEILSVILLKFYELRASFIETAKYCFADTASRLFTNEIFFSTFQRQAKDLFPEVISFYFDCCILASYDISDNIRKELPYEIEDSLINMEHRQLEAVEASANHRKMIEESFHIAFDDTEFRFQCKNIFDEMNSSGRGIRELSYTQDHLSYSNLNQFLLDTITHSDCNNDYETFLDDWYGEDHELKRLYHLMRYLDAWNLPYSLLQESEKEWVYDVVETILKRPFRENLMIFWMLSVLMRKQELSEKIKELIKKTQFHVECLIEMAVPAKITGNPSSTNIYDYISIDYLESYIRSQDILNYIIKNFPEMLNDSAKRTIAIGYLKRHISPLLKYEMKLKLKPVLLKFITSNFSSSGLFGAYDFLPDFSINLHDFDIVLLAENISMNSDESDPSFEFNTAYEILNYYFWHGSDVDKQIAAKCFQMLFERSDRLLHKKTYAEYYILIKSYNPEMNHWYTDYCLRDDALLSYISEKEDFAFSSFESIPDVERLAIAGLSDDDEKCRILFKIAKNSFTALFDKSLKDDSNQKFLSVLFCSLEKTYKETKSYRILELLNDMKVKVAIHFYNEPNFPSLEKLFKYINQD